MRPLFLAFILCLFFLPTIQAIAQKKDQVGFSSIQFQLKGDYPKDFDLQSFGKGDALTGERLLKLEKLNDSTYFAKFFNPYLTSYYFYLLKEYAKKGSGRNNWIDLPKPIYLSTPQKDEVSSGVKSILLSQKDIELSMNETSKFDDYIDGLGFPEIFLITFDCFIL